MHSYEWPRPALTVDSVIFLREPGGTKVLLIKRKNEPYKGYWALPGGYVEENEPLIQAALRELKEETSISDVVLRQAGAFGDPGRDPRGWQVTVAFWGIANSSYALAGDDAADATWHDVGNIIQNGMLEIACDHREVIQVAYDRMIDEALAYW